MRLYQQKIIIHLVCLVFIVLSCKDNKITSSENPKKQTIAVSSISSNKETFSVPNGYYIFNSENITVNNKTYKILALEKESEKDNEGNWHFNLPIVIVDDKNNKISQNNDLVYKFNDNCPADGFDGIAVKNNYFTVQQISCMDFLFVNSYTTFKIDDFGNIFLHKYGEEYTDRSDPNKKIAPKIWTTKDFGTKRFEEVSENFLKSLRK